MNYDQQIKDAIKAFDKSILVAMPTETVYGLAAPIDNIELLKKIFKIKRRPLFDPLICHVDGASMAQGLVQHWSSDAQLLADKFWPGPLTLVLPKSPRVDGIITSGLDTVGVRCPNHPMALALIKACGRALAAPSANLFMQTSPTCADHVRKDFPTDVYVLDGGDSQVGIESTIVALKNNVWEILRPGIISQTELKLVAPQNVSVVKKENSESINAPGQMKKHYCPEHPLVVGKSPEPTAADLEKIKSQLQFESFEIRSLPHEPLLAARALYQTLRKPLISGDFLYLYYPAKPDDDNWMAISDRLQKASEIWLV